MQTQGFLGFFSLFVGILFIYYFMCEVVVIIESAAVELGGKQTDCTFRCRLKQDVDKDLRDCLVKVETLADKSKERRSHLHISKHSNFGRNIQME